MVDDVGVSKEELCYVVAKEIVQKSGVDFIDKIGQIIPYVKKCYACFRGTRSGN